MIKAVFFDLDDTLYQYEGALRLGIELGVIKEFSAIIGGDTSQLYAEFKKSWRQLNDEKKGTSIPFNRFLWYDRFLRDKGIANESIAKDMEECYWQKFAENAKPYDDFMMVVESLSEEYNLFIITDGLRKGQMRRIESLGIGDYFSGVVCSSDVGNSLKPDPVIFQHALDLADCRFDEVVMIGDKPHRDIKGANDFGITSVWLKRGVYSQMPVTDGYVPDYTINNFFELEKLLLKL